ncbi:MAG: hypothetical protein IJR72_02125 [Oscillospiraceae bacterium]|nr:hypothetical protein [Oscillospiraceae bacterium]
MGLHAVMGFHVMEYMGRMVRKTGIAVVVALLMLVLMGQTESRRHTASTLGTVDAGPWSEEFSLTRDNVMVRLGVQNGAFPWGTGLASTNVDFWRSAGQDFFEITGEDGTVFHGVRREGTADTSNGLLLAMHTTSPDWHTRRGVGVGMPMGDTLSIYPEAKAEYDAHRQAGTYRYTYSGTAESGSGFSCISFVFENNTLMSMDITHVSG